ncbi:uncharacterized protein LOC113391094 [Ctenocephalides felis]|uniref:uncharacterized protein LOC113391092 n=1 Tax=Ctenocephalides felis TaxID=7515 RepID=UPI000E6E38B3|nr:uncharacterized protein LOC113391092 [Ctenocephalides felis]XP_026482848.1 uncharacterized protein LOC113391094 [Ctenocephalides felis]
MSARKHAGDEDYTSNEELGRGRRKRKEVVLTSEPSCTSDDEDVAVYEVKSNLGTKVRVLASEVNSDNTEIEYTYAPEAEITRIPVEYNSSPRVEPIISMGTQRQNTLNASTLVEDLARLQESVDAINDTLTVIVRYIQNGPVFNDTSKTSN